MSGTDLAVRIPESFEVIKADDSWWATELERFPGDRTACTAYFQKRIPAVPQMIREQLIGRYCPEAIQVTTRSSRENEDCLIRIYAGKRRRQGARPSPFFNLRNYGIHIDQMDELGVDTTAVVKILAEALAHCYWRAHVDANDVEFVFAPATLPTRSTAPRFRIARLEQELYIWMLDYDCVQYMNQNEEGIQQAVHAFYQNDAYFPRPHFYGHTRENVQLWEIFKKHLLDISNGILDDLSLAQEWVKQVEQEGRRRAAVDSSCVCQLPGDT